MNGKQIITILEESKKLTQEIKNQTDGIVSESARLLVKDASIGVNKLTLRAIDYCFNEIEEKFTLLKKLTEEK